MIRLILETDGGWSVRIVGGGAPSWPVVFAKRFETEAEALAALKAYHPDGTASFSDGSTHPVEVFRLPDRTEVMTWPAREDFDAWLAGRRSATKPKRKRKGMAGKPATDSPTAVPSAATGTLAEVPDATSSKPKPRDDVWADPFPLDTNSINEWRAAMRMVLEKRLKDRRETGMRWETKE